MVHHRNSNPKPVHFSLYYSVVHTTLAELALKLSHPKLVVQMFSCADVFVVSLWACIDSDRALFHEIIHDIPGVADTTLEEHFVMNGKMLLGLAFPCSASLLLLWFRHYIGKQLRRRLETRPRRGQVRGVSFTEDHRWNLEGGLTRAYHTKNNRQACEADGRTSSVYSVTADPHAGGNAPPEDITLSLEEASGLAGAARSGSRQKRSQHPSDVFRESLGLRKSEPPVLVEREGTVQQQPNFEPAQIPTKN